MFLLNNILSAEAQRIWLDQKNMHQMTCGLVRWWLQDEAGDTGLQITGSTPYFSFLNPSLDLLLFLFCQCYLLHSSFESSSISSIRLFNPNTKPSSGPV
jgi:hypothetical protein